LENLMQENPTVRATCLLEYYIGQGNYECAIEMARTLIHLKDENLLLRVQLARLLMWQGSDGARESIPLLEDLYNRSPQSILVKLDLAEAHVRSGLEKNAFDILQTIPQAERRVAAETMRTWARHYQNRDFFALKFWRTLFLEFEMLRVAKKI
jgi:predicted Zn-dependent protease